MSRKLNIKNLKPNTGNSGGYHQGYYKLLNPEKYIGDPNKIIFRSSYEKKFATYCDLSENIVAWSSEKFVIPYINPSDGLTKDYNVDFYVKVNYGDNVFKDFIVEVKPKRKLLKPNIPKKSITEEKMIKYYNAMKEWTTNAAKFAAAKKWAEQRGWNFIVVTEDFIF
jgi:hypothetical protein